MQFLLKACTKSNRIQWICICDIGASVFGFRWKRRASWLDLSSQWFSWTFLRFFSDSSFSDSLFSRCSHDTDSVYSTDVSICFSSPSVVSDSLSETDSTKENICSCDEGDPVPNIALPPLPNSSLANSEQLLPRPLVGSPSDYSSRPTPIYTNITYYSEQERLLCKQRYAFWYIIKV